MVEHRAVSRLAAADEAAHHRGAALSGKGAIGYGADSGGGNGPLGKARHTANDPARGIHRRQGRIRCKGHRGTGLIAAHDATGIVSGSCNGRYFYRTYKFSNFFVTTHKSGGKIVPGGGGGAVKRHVPVHGEGALVLPPPADRHGRRRWKQ